MNKLANYFLLMVSLLSIGANAQDEGVSDTTGKQRSFKLGLYVGSYFGNKYTAGAYDGYGFDLNGERISEFDKSWMYEKIINQYGGGYGQPDQIAPALGVNSTADWSFTKEDMPTNMHYTPSFLLGLQCRYSVDQKNAISLNLNVAKLNAVGNFTMTTRPPTGSSQINNSIQTFGIKGGEQRMMIQVGYSRIFGNNEKANLFAEAGLNITYAQFDKNEILINNLQISLTEFYDYQGIQAGYTKLPRGWGYGAYGGLGVNLTMSEKFTVQLIYTPSYEGVKIGNNPKLKTQHAIGLRAYYNF